MGVRTLAVGEEETLRSLRLRALEDAPEQFSSTWEREALRAVEDWRRWIRTGATFVFDGDGPLPRGLAAAVPGSAAGAGVERDDDRHVDHDDGGRVAVWLMAMWVEPEARGTGAASALVDAVVAWAGEHGATTVRLHVVEGNLRARALYERHGFRATGTVERDGRVEVAMERPAGAVT